MQDPASPDLPASMLLGLPEIDRDHAELFARIQRESREMTSATAESALVLFRGWIKLFASHFAHEERLMAATNYDAASHTRHHAAFLKRLEQLAAKFTESGTVAREANLSALDTLFRDALDGDMEFAEWTKFR